LAITFDAEQIIEQNEFVVDTDFTEINVEYWIDICIDYVNAEAGISIAHMTGVAGSKEASVTSAQNAALQPLLSCVLRENKKTQFSSASNTSSTEATSKSVTVGGISQSEGSSVSTAISASSAINNTANTIYREMYMRAIKKLVGISFEL
jgi:hypothetical protein